LRFLAFFFPFRVIPLFPPPSFRGTLPWRFTSDKRQVFLRSPTPPSLPFAFSGGPHFSGGGNKSALVPLLTLFQFVPSSRWMPPFQGPPRSFSPLFRPFVSVVARHFFQGASPPRKILQVSQFRENVTPPPAFGLFKPFFFFFPCCLTTPVLPLEDRPAVSLLPLPFCSCPYLRSLEKFFYFLEPPVPVPLAAFLSSPRDSSVECFPLPP